MDHVTRETYIDVMAGMSLLGLIIAASIDKRDIPDVTIANQAHNMALCMAQVKEERCKKTEQ